MTAIGYVIQPGEDIPDDVIELLDRTGDTWRLQPDGLWDCFVNDSDEPVGGSYEDINADLLRAKYTLLAVTAVREQPAEPARHAFVQGGADSKRCKRVFGSMFCGFGPGDFPHRCTQCGQPFTGRACGPTHALMATGQLDEIIADATPRELPAEPEPVHYYVPEFSGPSGATLCGLGIEEDMSTTGEAGKATCGACRAAACEEPAEPEPPFPTSPHPYERGPYAVDGAQVCGICGGRRAASVHRGYDPDGFLRLKGTATGDNQLDPEPTPCPKQSAHEAHTHSGFARPDGVPPAQCPGVPEPLQADASPLLDLVRELARECAASGSQLGAKPQALFARIAALVQREEADALQTITDRDLYHEWADKLAEGIAEHTGADIGEHSNVNNPWRVALESLDVLVPQRPVQARHRRGEAWWIHECGNAVPFRVAPDNDEHHCFPPCKAPGPWRPLLVGGDPAPEPTHDDFKRLAGIKRGGRRKSDAVDLGEALDEAVGDYEAARAKLLEVVTERDEARAQVNVEIQQADGHAAWADRLAWAALNHTDSMRLVTEEASGNEELWQLALDALTAQPDRQVLSLPEVPEGTEALVDRLGERWTPVRVELAPPREPRTAAEIWREMQAESHGRITRELAEALDREAGL